MQVVEPPQPCEGRRSALGRTTTFRRPSMTSLFLLLAVVGWVTADRSRNRRSGSAVQPRRPHSSCHRQKSATSLPSTWSIPLGGGTLKGSRSSGASRVPLGGSVGRNHGFVQI